MRAVPRQRPDGVLQHDQVLEDAGQRLRQRQDDCTDYNRGSRWTDGSAIKGLGRPREQRPWSTAGFGHSSAGPWRPPAAPPPPAAWFVALYLAALVALFISAFWQVDAFTGKVVHTWTLKNFDTLDHDPTYRTIALRTIGIAAAVTVTDALLALPFAFSMPRGLAPRRVSSTLFVCVLLPLWASYLVRVYAWRLILASDGILNWGLHKSASTRSTSRTPTPRCGSSSATSGCRS